MAAIFIVDAEYYRFVDIRSTKIAEISKNIETEWQPFFLSTLNVIGLLIGMKTVSSLAIKVKATGDAK